MWRTVWSEHLLADAFYQFAQARESQHPLFRQCLKNQRPTTIDCCACMEKGNTSETADATGVIVARESATMAADITNDRALGGNFRRSFKRKARNLP